MTKKSHITHVAVNGRMPACPASDSMTGIRANFSNQAVRVFGDRMYSKTLQINRLFDYLFYKHEFLFG